MSIIQPPSTGYPDWQRVTQNDGPALVNNSAIAPPATFGPFNVAPWYGVRFTAQHSQPPGAGVLYVIFAWYTDKALDTVIGLNRFYCVPSSVDWQGVIVPCLGPWVQIFARTLTGTDDLSLVVLPTNRTQGVSNDVEEGAVAHNSSLVGAASTLTLASSPVFWGPSTVAISATQNGTVEFIGSYGDSMQSGTPYPITAGVPWIQPWVLPRAHWSFVYTNTGAAPAGVDMQATTGASYGF